MNVLLPNALHYSHDLMLKEYFLDTSSIDKKQTTLLPFLVGIGADNFAIGY